MASRGCASAARLLARARRLGRTRFHGPAAGTRATHCPGRNWAPPPAPHWKRRELRKKPAPKACGVRSPGYTVAGGRSPRGALAAGSSAPGPYLPLQMTQAGQTAPYRPLIPSSAGSSFPPAPSKGRRRPLGAAPRFSPSGACEGRRPRFLPSGRPRLQSRRRPTHI